MNPYGNLSSNHSSWPNYLQLTSRTASDTILMSCMYKKNVCDSLIGTLLNIKGKTKDDVNARLDILEMNIREELTLRQVGKHTYLSPACHTLSKKERISFCYCLKSLKVPQGYFSNFRSLMLMQDLKLVGLKSHDYHVLMQQLLPIAIHEILPKNVRQTIIQQCSFSILFVIKWLTLISLIN